MSLPSKMWAPAGISSREPPACPRYQHHMIPEVVEWSCNRCPAESTQAPEQRKSKKPKNDESTGEVDSKEGEDVLDQVGIVDLTGDAVYFGDNFRLPFDASKGFTRKGQATPRALKRPEASGLGHRRQSFSAPGATPSEFKRPATGNARQSFRTPSATLAGHYVGAVAFRLVCPWRLLVGRPFRARACARAYVFPLRAEGTRTELGQDKKGCLRCCRAFEEVLRPVVALS